MNRRDFMKTTLAGLTVLSAGDQSMIFANKNKNLAKIALVKNGNRKEAIKQLMEMINFLSPRGKHVFLKPNFNTADPFPGSTHNDTLRAIITEFQRRGSRSITVGDRSGPQPTGEVLEKKGIFKIAEALKFNVADFSQLTDDNWIHYKKEGDHWKNGFLLAKPAVESEYLVTTHCLKTHQYGGVFTLSLKLTVGMAPKKLMRELHKSPHMRRMIAELNHPFQPKLLIMDGVDAFVDGGPMTGKRKKADVFLAGTDRIAIDAVGVAILKELGSNEAIMGKKIFGQEQIQRAVELKLGISRPEQIKIITDDPVSRAYAKKIQEILLKG